jgi:hypothetical protein
MHLAEKEWLMLNFTLPKEPSRVRVSVWRKLKKYGSVSIGQSMWLLPLSDKNIGIFNEISNEITQNNGNAYIVKADFIDTVSSNDVVSMFNKARDEEYKEFLGKCEDFFGEIEKETARENFSFGELEENEEEFNKLAEWFKKIAVRDFFNAPQKAVSEQKLGKCKQLLDEFSDKVYESNEDR